MVTKMVRVQGYYTPETLQNNNTVYPPKSIPST